MSWDSVDDWLAERVKHPEEIHRDSHNTVQHYLQLIQEELAELRIIEIAWKKLDGRKHHDTKGWMGDYYRM